MKKTHLVQLMAVFFLTLLIALDIKSFAIWSQIEYLWAGRINPFKANSITDLGAHGLRYLLLYPLLITSEVIGVHYNKIFELCIPILAYAVIRNVWSVIKVISFSRKDTIFASVFVSALFITLFLGMNGRITLAFFGYSLIFRILINCHYQERKLSALMVALLIVGILFCSVSSGTLFSGFLLLFLAAGTLVTRIYKRLRVKGREMYLFVSLIFSVYFFGNFITIGINKNILFFGGGLNGFFEMLSHGTGKFLLPLADVMPIPTLLILSITLSFFGLYLINIFKNPYLLLQFLCAASIGVFGHSTLSLITIPLAVCLVHIFFQERKIGSNVTAPLLLQLSTSLAAN